MKMRNIILCIYIYDVRYIQPTIFVSMDWFVGEKRKPGNSMGFSHEDHGFFSCTIFPDIHQSIDHDIPMINW